MVRNNSPARDAKLPRESRIRKKEDFRALKKKSSKIVTRHWILFYFKNESAVSRLAITVSGRYGSAVQRNWFKRWIRESFRRELKHIPGYELHFIAKQKPTNLEKKSYKAELDEDFQRLVHRLNKSI